MGTPTMATSIAENGQYLDVNDAMLERLGYAREEMVGRLPEEFTTPETAQRIRDELRPTLRRTGKLEDKPVSFITKSGDVVDCTTSAVVEYDTEGEFVPGQRQHGRAQGPGLLDQAGRGDQDRAGDDHRARGGHNRW